MRNRYEIEFSLGLGASGSRRCFDSFNSNKTITSFVLLDRVSIPTTLQQPLSYYME